MLDTVVAIAALMLSGVILWWRTRRTFQFRLWPKRMSRPSILMHHRDLGVVVAPLLLISIVTGTMTPFWSYTCVWPNFFPSSPSIGVKS